MTYSQDGTGISLENGWPIVKNFDAKDYHFSSEMWSIYQDKLGLLYFGTNEGVLEYDGNTWRLIRIPNNSSVRSICMDDSGRIFLTGSSDFGYLAADEKGQNNFVSLRHHVKQRFGEVWDVVSVSNGVYYKTPDKIFHWDGEQISVIDSVESYRLYTIADEVYARDDGNGLVRVSGDSTILIADGEFFADTGVYNMRPFDDQVLVTTSREGLYLYNGESFSRFQTEADDFLMAGQIYNICELRNGNYAIATRRAGVYIIDKNGRLIQRLNTESGLATDVIFDVYQDKENILWLATSEGISRVEISSTFSLLPHSQTGNAPITTLYKFHDTFFASNVYGIFYLDKFSTSFKAVNGVKTSGNNFISINNTLLASTIDMIFTIDGRTVTKPLPEYNNALLYRSAIDSSIVYAIDRSGLFVFQHDGENLQQITAPIPISEELDALVENKDGSLWLSTFYEGVIHVRSSTQTVFSATEPGQISLDLYNADNGLPGNMLRLFSVEGKAYFATDAGIFTFNAETKTFIPSNILGESFTIALNTIKNLKKDYQGNLWVLADTPTGMELGKAIRQESGQFRWHPEPSLRRLELSSVITFYPEYDAKTKQEYLWIGSEEGLIRYSPQVKPSSKKTFQTFIRSVYVNQDSLIFGGAASSKSRQQHISADARNIVFRFSATSYAKPEATQFQYRLAGNDAEWSHWSAEPRKEYTNLSAGDYTFQLRAQNVYGELGSEDFFSFTVLPPWYLTWWAYLLYALVTFGCLLLVRRWELRRVNKKHALQLERMAFSKLKEVDKLKSQFYANISHEFRTPLTLILGQTDSVISADISQKEKGKLHVVNKNARRLLSLINELLDLSKLEAGRMKLNAEPHDLIPFLKRLFYSFESYAETQKINMSFKTASESITVLFEPEKMEKIFYNLISNAFKFTPDHGEISIVVKRPNTTQVEIIVKDSGQGIPADQIPYIFDRFYQADATLTRGHEGTGIGLSLTKELVELHNGSISVKSKEGQGSYFTILLPVSNALPEKSSTSELSDAQHSMKQKISDLEESDAAAEASLSDPDKNDQREIILIVEDNQDVRAFISEQLSETYQVVQAGNGKEGIKKAEALIPDLIITDVMMPEMDGYQFSRAMKENEKTSHVPIIMLTAKAALDDKIEGLETGVDAYLTKPFNAREMQVIVKNLIFQRQQLRRRFSQSTIIKPSEISTTSIDQQFIEKAVSIIETNFDDEAFSVDMFAEALNMSLSQLNRKLNALVGQPAGKLIRSLRLQRAADLLKQNAGTVAEICYQVGFNDQGYFARVFKAQFQCSPSEYRKANADL